MNIFRPALWQLSEVPPAEQVSDSKQGIVHEDLLDYRGVERHRCRHRPNGGEAGYRVALAARSADKLESLAQELGGPDKALAIACDVASYEDQQKMAEATLAAFGRIDVVFANAGVGAKGSGTAGGDPDNWREMVLTNVLGCVLTVKVCLARSRRTRAMSC
jgi:hypothetical protein